VAGIPQRRHAEAIRLAVAPDRLGRLGRIRVHQEEARLSGEAVVDPAQLRRVAVDDRALRAREHEDGGRSRRARQGLDRAAVDALEPDPGRLARLRPGHEAGE